MADDSTTLSGAAIIGLGEQTDKIEKLLAEFETDLNKFGSDKFGVIPVEFDGQPAFRWMLPETQTEATFGLRGKYFVIGFGKDSVSGDSLTTLAMNSKTDPPKWLLDGRQELSVERFSSMAYLDSDAAIELVEFSAGGMFQIRSIFDQIVGDDVAEIVWLSGLDSRGCITRTSVHTAGKLTGILAALDGAPLSKIQLEDFPADATIGGATRFSTKKLLALIEDVAIRTGQEAAIEDAFGEFQDITGMRLKDEFLQSIGDFIYFY